MGPQCSDPICGSGPNNVFCQPATYGIPNPNPSHGNSTNNADIKGLYNRIMARIRLTGDIQDGLSNTIMIGESLPGSHDHLASNRWWGYNDGNAHCTTIIPINHLMPNDPLINTTCLKQSNNWNVSWGFKSFHTGGANFVFADGSVKFLSQAIDHRTYQYLGGRSDGNPVTIP